MSRSRLLALVLTLFVLPFALVACGEDNSEDEDQITEAITASATTTDPSACTELQTQNFIEQTSGATGAKAVEECRRDQQEEAVADSVDVSDVEIDDGNATAVVAFEGGFIGGQSLEVGFVDEDGQWKLDELIRFVDFDRATYIDTLVRGITEESSGDQQLESCVRGGLEDVADEQLQATFLENDDTIFEDAIAPCFEGRGA